MELSRSSMHSRQSKFKVLATTSIIKIKCLLPAYAGDHKALTKDKKLLTWLYLQLPMV